MRSTPLRLTVILIAVFTTFLAAGLGTAYVTMQRALAAGVRDNLDSIATELSGIADPEERAERAGEIAVAANPGVLMLSYEAAGQRIGNLPAGTGTLSDGIVQGDRIGPTERLAESYRVEVRNIDGARLTLLGGRESLAELNEIFIAILGFSLLPALLLTSAIGMVAARRTDARVGAIRQTLHLLAGGTLSARVGGPARGTDLGDIARDLDRMATAQEAATEALRQIGADLAHDLKTPIQRVAVRLERLAEADLPPAIRDELDAVQEETSGIIATFQSLLQIAQLEGGQGRDHFAPVDLARLVADMAEIYAPAAEESGHVLEAHVSMPVPVTGDRNLLARLIANLVENALRHAPAGPVTLSLSGTCLTVRDRGPGIPESQRDAVLRRLVRLETSRSTPGSGLGLALVKAIADLHGAALSLADARPGLEVQLKFPDIPEGRDP